MPFWGNLTIDVTEKFMEQITITDRDGYCDCFVLVVLNCRFRFILCLSRQQDFDWKSDTLLAIDMHAGG